MNGYKFIYGPSNQ